MTMRAEKIRKWLEVLRLAVEIVVKVAVVFRWGGG